MDSEVEVSSQPVEVKEMIKPQDLVRIEKIVRDYANAVLRRNHINPEHVNVRLVQNMTAVMSIDSGHVVELHLLWPHCQPNINTLLADFCRLFKTGRLRRTMEVVPYMYSHVGTKKFLKERFTEKESIVLDLLPKRRLRLIQKTITVLEDVSTGITVHVSEETKKTGFYGEQINEWFEVSRLVREHQPLQLHKDDDIEDVAENG